MEALERLRKERSVIANALASQLTKGVGVDYALVDKISELDEWIDALEKGELRCRYCGGERFRVWYKAEESQGIDILGVEEGEVRYEYDGDTESGDLGPDEEFVCRHCSNTSTSLEYLLGLTEEES